MKKLLPKSINNPKGFTLVELLVVISIIAILSVIGITLFGGVQKNARDAKRRGDINAIASAMEANYNSTTGQYTALAANMFSSSTGVPIDPVNTNVIPNSFCPGVCKYCVIQGTTAQTGAACAIAITAVAGVGVPAGG